LSVSLAKRIGPPRSLHLALETLASHYTGFSPIVTTRLQSPIFFVSSQEKEAYTFRTHGEEG
ncbi:MAG: hypothetical protein LKJ96_04860, partial [Sphaerochaeta sp.]|nr:hypothetical protein [Sphaerochaeta sp.]